MTPVTWVWSIVCSKMAIKSSMCTHDIHCRPLPTGPPTPNLKGGSIWANAPPFLESTTPIRTITGRTPIGPAALELLGDSLSAERVPLERTQAEMGVDNPARFVVQVAQQTLDLIGRVRLGSVPIGQTFQIERRGDGRLVEPAVPRLDRGRVAGKHFF